MKKEKMDGRIIIKISILWLFALVIIASLSIAFFKNDIFAFIINKTYSIYILTIFKKNEILMLYQTLLIFWMKMENILNK